MKTYYYINCSYNPDNLYDISKFDKQIQKAVGAKICGSGYGDGRDLSFSFRSSKRAVEVFQKLAAIKTPKLLSICLTKEFE